MVMSRPDTTMQRRSKRGAPEPLLTPAELENGKRTKVHAQRKFAQGSALSSPALTPVKDKNKSNGSLLSSEPEIISTKRPKTHDFLTFLCLRGTPILPARLDFFAVSSSDSQVDDDFGSQVTATRSAGKTSVRPDRMLELPSTSSAKKCDVTSQQVSATRRKPAVMPTSAVQALKKKYQDQRLLKQNRSGVLNKLAQKVKDKNKVRTRSTGHVEVQKKPSTLGRPVSVKPKVSPARNVAAKSAPRRATRSSGLAPPTPLAPKSGKSNRVGLRSGGRLNAARQLVLSKARQAKARRAAEAKKISLPAPSDFSSEDDEPLVNKTKVAAISSAKQVAMKRLKQAKARQRQLSPVRMQTRSARGDVNPSASRKINTPSSPVKPQQRLSRKTKEAAAVYMQLLGKKWMSPDDEEGEEDDDEDSLSLYSFPEIRKSTAEKKSPEKKVPVKLSKSEVNRKSKRESRESSVDEKQLRQRSISISSSSRRSSLNSSPQRRNSVTVQRRSLRGLAPPSPVAARREFTESDDEPLGKKVKPREEKKAKRKEKASLCSIAKRTRLHSEKLKLIKEAKKVSVSKLLEQQKKKYLGTRKSKEACIQELVQSTLERLDKQEKEAMKKEMKKVDSKVLDPVLLDKKLRNLASTSAIVEEKGSVKKDLTQKMLQKVEKSPQKVEKAQQKEEKLAQKVEKMPQKVDKLTQNDDKAAQKINKMSQKAEKTPQKVEKVQQKSPQKVEKLTQKIENVAQKVEKIQQKEEKAGQKVDKKEEKMPQKVEKSLAEVDKSPEKVEKVAQKIEKLTQKEDKAQKEEKPTPKVEKTPQKVNKSPLKSETTKPEGKKTILEVPRFAAKKSASILPVSAKKLNLARRVSQEKAGCQAVESSHCTKCGRGEAAEKAKDAATSKPAESDRVVVTQTLVKPLPPPPLIITSPMLQAPQLLPNQLVTGLTMLNHPAQRELVLLTPQNPAAGPSKFIVCRKEELAVLQSSAGGSGGGLQLMMVPTSSAAATSASAQDLRNFRFNAGKVAVQSQVVEKVQTTSYTFTPQPGPSTKSPEEKRPIFQRKHDKSKQRSTAFSPENESSVYAFQSEPEEVPPSGIPFRRKTKEEVASTGSSVAVHSVGCGTEVLPSKKTGQRDKLDQPSTSTKPVSHVSRNVSSNSIAVQVNFDDNSTTEPGSPRPSSPPPVVPAASIRHRSSFECSTQTESEEAEGDHLFYIPLQREPQQLIQGVEVKLGTEGPTGPNQRVIMRAKLVTKPPERFSPAINTTGMVRSSQHPTTMLGNAGNSPTSKTPIIGTVQPTTRPSQSSSSQTMTPSSLAVTKPKSSPAPPVAANTTSPLCKPNPAQAKTSPVVKSTPAAQAKTSPVVKSTPAAQAKSSPVVKSTPAAQAKSSPVVKSAPTVQAKSSPAVKSAPTVQAKSSPIIKSSPAAQAKTSPVVKPSPVKAATQGKPPSDTCAPPHKAQKSGGKQKVTPVAKAHKVVNKRSSVDNSSPSTSTGKTSTKRPAIQRQSSLGSAGHRTPRLPEPIATPASFPSPEDKACFMEAPTFYPTEKDFQDPMEYIERIRPRAEQFGLCRIVPPSSFKPECKVSDDMRFTAYNHYVHKMLNRWGPNVKELTALKKYLKSQNVDYTHPPWIGGMEVDLPRFHQTVQQLGGLMEVIQKKSWTKVADLMKIPKSAQDRVTKLDDIYCKFLLAYSTLTPEERQALFDEVEGEWRSKQEHTDSTDDDDDSFDESEECITKGRNMPLNAFYRIARNTMSMWFRTPEPPASEVEAEYWHIAQEGSSHVCVHAGSIDSGGGGYGFPCNKNSPCAKHPWNLKVLSNNCASVLRSMGHVMGVTVPTLHVGMLFSTCCWYRDPHSLPWIEYLHTGASKIWYGIPDSQSQQFRSTLNKVVPKFCRDQTVWLPSDTAMVPPSVLVSHGVSLCRTVQEPGQFILVFPRAFTSSVCAGYLVSESVYFAQPTWLDTAEQVFKELKDSCEPTMFSLERLLFSIAQDNRCSVEVLRHVQPQLRRIVEREERHREALKTLGLKSWERLPLPDSSQKGRKSARSAAEDETDYECEVCRENLYLSLVTNSHEEGVYCLPHAISLLTKKKHHLKFCKLLYTQDMDELEELLHKLDDKIETKVAKKCQNKHAGTSK